MTIERRRLLLVCLALLVAIAGCSSASSGSSPDAAALHPSSPSGAATHAIATPHASGPRAGTGALAGMPPQLNPHDIYAADRPGQLSPVVRRDRPLIYVPNSLSNTVSVIDPKTYKVIATHPVGALPQHVTPSYDLRHLYVLNDNGNSVTVINPRDGSFGRTVPVADPYNMYFTPDGKHGIVVAERLGRLDFVDPHTLRLQHALPVNCRGIDHADFSANGRYAIFSCEFSGQLVKVDIAAQRVVGYLSLPTGSMPQDVKLSPDGKVFYVADMMHNGVWLVDGGHLRIIGFRHTGRGAHGLYISRDSRFLYVTNRMEGSISLIDLRTRRVVRKWRIPGGGSPDMGGVSANGKVLWLSGRYNGVVYAISTSNGHLIAKIPVGRGPHGLCVYPQPGRYSLGHTGVFR
jgi:YVTN family beta-propeller protein